MGVHQSPEVYAKVKELLGIPIDEPILVLRAQDKCAVDAITQYQAITLRMKPVNEETKSWQSDLEWVKSDFRSWQRDNREKVKVPD